MTTTDGSYRAVVALASLLIAIYGVALVYIGSKALGSLGTGLGSNDTIDSNAPSTYRTASIVTIAFGASVLFASLLGFIAAWAYNGGAILLGLVFYSLDSLFVIGATAYIVVQIKNSQNVWNSNPTTYWNYLLPSEMLDIQNQYLCCGATTADGTAYNGTSTSVDPTTKSTTIVMDSSNFCSAYATNATLTPYPSGCSTFISMELGSSVLYTVLIALSLLFILVSGAIALHFMRKHFKSGTNRVGGYKEVLGKYSKNAEYRTSIAMNQPQHANPNSPPVSTSSQEDLNHGVNQPYVSAERIPKKKGGKSKTPSVASA